MDQLICSNGECGEVIIGRGVLLWDASGEVDWGEHNVGALMVTRNSTGDETQALALHLTCFQEVMVELEKQEANAALTVVLGGVGDFIAALTEEV